tara:strand:- start:60 stop:770 length:711 start_codon:yes stop_codon:yes gene_type:complete
MFNFLDTELGDFISRERSLSYSIEDLITPQLKNNPNMKILDLGSGDGKLTSIIQQHSGIYIGCDIGDSPEAQIRTKQDVPFVIYAGESLPFLDASFDCVVLDHVLEHIEKPHFVFKEIARVLKDDGILMGSVSQLETYHSHSLWNVSPYGLWCLTKNTPLTIKELRPGIDFLSLIIGIYLFPSLFKLNINKETFINKIIYIFGKLLGKTVTRINAAQLFLAGHYLFIIKKERSSPK